MKQLLLSLILSLTLLLPVAAQDTITLPRKVVEQMFIDATDKPYLEYELNKSDSVIRVYDAERRHDRKIIKELQLSVAEYKVMVKVVERNEQLSKQENKTLKKIVRNLKIKNTITTIIAVVELIVIVLIVL